jgi:hypothetical protein
MVLGHDIKYRQNMARMGLILHNPLWPRECTVWITANFPIVKKTVKVTKMVECVQYT